MSTYLNEGDLSSFDGMRDRVTKLADLNHEDILLDLRACKFTPEGRIYIPNRGFLEVNEHSLNQLSAIAGINWNKWFCTDDKLISKEEVQEELMRRFSRKMTTVLLRTRSHAKAKADSDGVIRAFLSPSYQPIDDVRVFDRMAAAWGARTNEFKFYKPRCGETDFSTHYSVLFPQEETFASGGGEHRTGDIMRCGFKLRNSEVGCCAITMDEFWLRLVCLNGMMAMVGRDRLFYRQHRTISNEDLDQKLVLSFQNIENRQAEQRNRFQTLMGVVYKSHADAKEQLTRFMDRKKLPKRVIEKALSVYDFSTHSTGDGDAGEATGYWVLNALTQTARDLEPEARHELEMAAGSFLMSRGAAA